MDKRRKRALAALITLAVAFEIFSRVGWNSDDSWRVGQLPDLDRLALRLSAEYYRSLDKDDFSLYYRASRPDTIVLTVRYKPKMDQYLLRKIIASAELNARDVASEQFGIAIKTRVDQEALSE